MSTSLLRIIIIVMSALSWLSEGDRMDMKLPLTKIPLVSDDVKQQLGDEFNMAVRSRNDDVKLKKKPIRGSVRGQSSWKIGIREMLCC